MGRPEKSRNPDIEDVAALLTRLNEMFDETRDGEERSRLDASNGARGPAALPQFLSPHSAPGRIPQSALSLHARLEKLRQGVAEPERSPGVTTRHVPPPLADAGTYEANGVSEGIHMQPIVANQCWLYRVPRGFEGSRLIVGAVVEVGDGQRIICNSVVDAPWRMNASPFETITIPFLPMTETAFRATTVDLEGFRAPPAAFAEKFEAWKRDAGGLAAFTVPFEGFLEQMIELQKLWKKGATRKPTPEIARILNAAKDSLNGGLITERHPVPRSKQDFEDVLARLRSLRSDDLKGKLVIAGFQPNPSADQRRCFECNYFLPHCSLCDLPELSIPVEPYWSCRLWSI